MFKVFINDTPLILTHTEGVLSDWKNNPKALIAHYAGKQKFLHNYIDLLEKAPKYDLIVLYHENLEKLWDDFQDLYKIIEAAGGVVWNQINEVLVIYRLETWDLPKGKIDEGETPEIAAVREVQEETGIDAVTLQKFLTTTYHTYEHKGKRILKRTFWYIMNTTETTLTPQHSENIELAEWVNLKDFLAQKPKIYRSILDVLLAAEQ